MKTKVIFRKWKHGDILALFPEDPGDMSPYTCSAYEHVGQHSAADPQYVMRQTKPAKPSEYADLKKELENYGPDGYDLQVIHRNRYEFIETRRKQLRKSILDRCGFKDTTNRKKPE